MSDAANAKLSRQMKMGLIGGGGSGFIGKVHVTAATLDREAELVAGALSSDPSRALIAAQQFRIEPDRAYGSYQQLLDRERKRPKGDRVDFVSIAAPNHMHAEVAIAALDAGFHVVCEKPMTTTIEDAQRLAKAVESSGRVFALTHNYSGYPMVRQAREMIAGGDLGELLAVRVSYVQGWMHGMSPDTVPARGAWKSDPKKNGFAGSLGDVGTHAFHLARFVTGLEPQSLLSRMNSYSAHHELDDYGHAIIQFSQGATGLVTWSQVSHGRLNDLAIEIDGTDGSISWRQEDPNRLVVRSLGSATQILERNPNAPYITGDAADACRLPAGHPEAFFEAFANVYRDAIAAMQLTDGPVESEGSARTDGSAQLGRRLLYPTVNDGVDGVRFMHLCLESQEQDSSWCQW